MSPNLHTDERLSSGVIKLAKHLNERLALLRLRNDALMTEAERGPLLGEISAVKELISFMEKKPVVVPDDSHFPE